MKTTKKIKVSVWGLGKHALLNILPSLAKSKYLSIYGVLSREDKKVVECCKKWKCRTWNNAEEMLSDRDLEVVYLSTPIGLHHSQGLKIIEAKKHLWCEKPLTTSLLESQELVTKSDLNNVSVCEAFMYLYHPQYSTLNEYLESSKLGKIRMINIKFGLPKLKNLGFRLDPELGGSCLLDVGSYPISMICSLFSDKDIQVVKVYRGKTHEDSIDMDGMAMLKVDSSANCLLEWAYNRSYRNEIDIWCEKGSLFSNKIFSKDQYFIPTIAITETHGEQSIIKIPAANHFEIMLEFFRETLTDHLKALKHKDMILKHASLLDKIKELQLAD